MLFQNYDDFVAQRKELTDLLEVAMEMKDEAEIAKMEAEVKAIDAKFEDYKVELANEAAIEKTKEAKPMMEDLIVSTEMTDSVDYRKDFMNYVRTGKLSNNVTTSNAGAAVPTTVLNRIWARMIANGQVLKEVTRTNVKGGLSIPAINLKPAASWVAEGAGSTDQTMSLTAVTFAYNKLRCSIAVSLEMDEMAIDAFEDMLVELVGDAMMVALETAIISGSGTLMPTGILNSAAPSGQALTSFTWTYANLVNAESALPSQYESNAKWCMTKAKFMSVVGMVDSTGQPIARVNYGVGGRPERSILGRDVIIVPATYFGSSTVDAFIYDFKDYVLNTNKEVTVKKYEDNTNDNQVTKAVMLVDGKKVDNGSLVTIEE